MDKEFGWGWVIFILLVLWFFVGGGLNTRGALASECGCSRVSNCEIEKQEIIDSARTQYLIEQQASATRDVVQATANATQTKIDYYEYMNLRDALNDSKTENMFLRTQLADNAQFNAINGRLSEIECKMLKSPAVSGLATMCPPQAYAGYYGFNGCGC